MRQQKERPRLGYTGEATMIHDNFPGHYTAYKTYYIIIIIVAIIALFLQLNFPKKHLHISCRCAFFLPTDVSGGCRGDICRVCIEKKRYMHDKI